MPDDALIQDLLLKLLDEDGTPESICQNHPHVLTQVRSSWRELNRVRAEVEHLFPATATAPEPPPPPADGPPAIPGYEIVRRVGRGAMGTVYEAVHATLGKRVALKVLSSTGGDDRVQRFLREARIAAGLHHTNIVPVFDFGTADGIPFYAMQFIEGRPLNLGTEPAFDAETVVFESAAKAARSGTTRTPFPRVEADEAARWVLQAAEGLAHAHERGVVHRDIKPGNLLLDRNGVVWVTDFGLAFNEDEMTLTRDGAILGTPRYMAPEQARGESSIDARADVYALGITLYELLTGHPALPGRELVEILRQAQEHVPPPVRKYSRSVPRDLETIVSKAIAKRREDRYASTRSLADDLKRFLAGEPIQARRITVFGRTWRWAKRNPAVASLVAAVLLVFTAGMLASGYYASVANREAETSARLANEARLREADALVQSARGIRLSRRPGQRFDALDALKQAADIGRLLEQPSEWFIPLRNEAMNVLALPDVRITQEFGRWDSDTVNVDLSADFDLYIQSYRSGVCVIRRVKDDSEVCRIPGLENGKVRAHFGPGRWFGVVEGDSEHGRAERSTIWELIDGAPVRRYGPYAGSSWSFRPDGRLLVAVNADLSGVVVDMPSGATAATIDPFEKLDTFPLHPSAPACARTGYFYRGRIEFLNFQTREVRSVTMPWGCGSGTCSWSPDGSVFAAPAGDLNRLLLFDYSPELNEPVARPMIELTMSGGVAAAFHPSGDRLMCGGWSQSLDLVDAGSGRVLFTHPPVGATFSTKFDSTGRRFGGTRIGDHRMGIWSVADGRECRTIAGRVLERNPGYVTPAISPDGRLAVLCADDGLSVVDLWAGREAAVIKWPGEKFEHIWLTFDRDGRLIANSYDGCYRWALTHVGNDYRLGPPERIPFHPGNREIAASRDGTVLAQSMYRGYGMQRYAGGWVWHAGQAAALPVEDVMSVVSASISPDGRWAAFGAQAMHVRVYDTRTRKRVWTSADGGVHGLFSPDGRWLATDADGGRCNAVGTWEPGVKLGPGRITDFSPDSRMAVLVSQDGIMRLVEVETGRELVRFEDPDQTFNRAKFTPDGGRLVTAAKDGVRVWDLRLMRRQLSEMGLDWDGPTLPEVAPIPSPTNPAKIEIVGGVLPGS